MKPLIVLLSFFFISIFVVKLVTQKYDFSLSARIGMCATLFFTAMGHFAFPKGMAMMMPTIFPLKIETIYVTGVLEIVLGIGLLIPSIRVYTGWFLIVFFILLLPANIYAAIRQINYQKGTYDGKGIAYLWFRIPLQILFIVWTYLSTQKVS